MWNQMQKKVEEGGVYLCGMRKIYFFFFLFFYHTQLKKVINPTECEYDGDRIIENIE